MQHSKIAIIGAGVSGLAAAVKLANAGHRNITLFEARREAGGRTRSFLDPKTGDVLDNGQHIMMGCYTATLEYLEQIGSQDRVRGAPLSILFWDSKGVRSFTIDRTFGPPGNLLTALMRTSLLSLPEKHAAAVLGKAIWRNKLPTRLDDLTCANLFQEFDQPSALIEKLWSPIVLATLNAAPEQASAMLFVSVVREAFFSSRKASALVIPKCGLSELLIDPAIQTLERKGVTMRLGTPVRNIQIEDDGIRIVTDGDDTMFDSVISTAIELPSSIPYSPSPISYSPIMNAYFWLDRPIFSGPVHTFVGMTLQWAFPKPSNFSAQRVALTVSAADALVEKPNDEITQMLWADLARTVPAARDATLMHSQVIREKRATPLFTPIAQKARPVRETDDKRFILAGDTVQNGLPATIEGAVRNGFRAADLVLESEFC